MTNKIAVVTFETSSQRYDFLTDIEGLEQGDKVVVETRHGLAIAKVYTVKETSSQATAWVVQKIDLATHQLRKEKEQKIKEIRAKMEARRKEVQELEIYRILAKEDPDMAKLLDQLQAIG